MYKSMKSLFKYAILAAVMSVAAFANAGIVYNGANTAGIDFFAPNVAKIQRPTGTTDAFVKFADGSSTTFTNGWQYVAGSAKVWQSYDGANGAGNTATAGLDGGYDAVAVVKNNILYQGGVPGTKCATYNMLGAVAVTICSANYYDWVWSRTSPY